MVALKALGALGADVVVPVSLAAGAEVVPGGGEGAGARLTVCGGLLRGFAVVTGCTALTVGAHRVVHTLL